MRLRILLVVALAGSACTTTKHATVDSAASATWLAEHESRTATVRLKAPWSPSLHGRLASQPPLLRLAGSSDERSLPLTEVREVQVVNRARGAGEWALAGAVAGVAFGIVFGVLTSDYGRTFGCSEGRSCGDRNLPKAAGAGLVYGLVLTGPIAAGLGALVGAMAGHRDVLTFE
jgi:hypothetical protein